MTGPRIPLVHPHCRRARHLLPFLLAIATGPLACTSDQPTGPMADKPLAAATRSHPYLVRRSVSPGSAAALSMQAAMARASASLSQAALTAGSGAKVLLLADVEAASTTALATSMSAAGFQVTVRPGPEYTWDGTDPALSGFAVVVHLNGATFDTGLSPAVQTALSNFVASGGGFVGAQWNGFELSAGQQIDMPDLVLQGYLDGQCAPCTMTYTTVQGEEGHPVLAGLPSSFTFEADANDAGPQVNFESEPSTVLMLAPSGGPAVLARKFGSGKVVNFSFAPNYAQPGEERTLLDPNIQQLYVNAVRWLAREVLETQTLTFGALPDKVFGNAAFSISATASSGLPVSFSVAGQCTLAGTTVAITAAGSCTITARQDGDMNYSAAPEVAQSFAIARAPATLAVGTEFTYDGMIKQATVTTSPAGLSGVTVTYTLAGSPVSQPVNAGVYQVLATLDNPNYQAQAVPGTLTILPALPVIQWASPAAITAGTPLGATQLNATATGVGGVGLTGSFVYLPAAGSVLAAGVGRPISVEFTPGSANYTRTLKTVTITVLPVQVPHGLTFSGFFRPVHNLPLVNRVKAGHAIPVSFSIEGQSGSSGLRPGSPTSIAMTCRSNMSERAVDEDLRAGSSRLQVVGNRYTYTWKTSSAWAGTCRRLVVTLADGSTREALFHFPKKSNDGRRDRDDDDDDHDRGDGDRGHDGNKGHRGNDRHEAEHGKRGGDHDRR